MTEAGRSLWLIAPTGSSAEEDERSREYIEGEVAHKAINVYSVGTFSSVVYGIVQTIRVCGGRVRHFKRQPEWDTGERKRPHSHISAWEDCGLLLLH